MNKQKINKRGNSLKKKFTTIGVSTDLRKELNILRSKLQVENDNFISYGDVVNFLVKYYKNYGLSVDVRYKLREIMLANNFKDINETVKYLLNNMETKHKN